MAEIKQIQADARANGFTERPRWPMIVLRTPKGWTGPKEVDGKPVEGTFRAHQVPMGDMDRPEHIKILEEWMKSYRPEELFDAAGRLRPELAELGPAGHAADERQPARQRRPAAARTAAARLPRLRRRRARAGRRQGRGHPRPGRVHPRRDQAQRREPQLPHLQPRRDDLQPLDAVFEVTDRQFTGEILPGDDHVAPEGRVMEMLSEHQCQGWLEGYLLTGRHGFFSCYEAFIHIIDSMFNQHAKWLKTIRHIPWRRPIASLNYLLTSHVWRQDHNGFSHQDPGFIDHVVNKKAEVIRVYLPPDANTLLSVTDHCLRSRNYVNVIVAGKQPEHQWLDMDEAIKHCTAGIGIWEWASNDQGGEPDVVMACCGDVPTLETLAAVDLLAPHLPELKIRVVNVVDLMKLQPPSEHPHGLTRRRFRRPVHHRQADHLRLPRLSLADPPPDLPPDQPREPARPRLQGGGDHHHALRHGGAERPGPLPPGRRRDRPRAAAGRQGGLRQAGDPRQADRAQAVHRRARRGHARDPRLAVGSRD